MRTMQPDFDGKPVGWILERAWESVAEDERRGGPYLAVARVNRRVLGEHPAPSATGEPCPKCGEPWPCGTINSVFAQD